MYITKVLTAQLGRLSLSVGRENGPEWGFTTVTVTFNPELSVI